MSRQLVAVVGRRGVVQNGFVAGLSLDLSLDLAEVLPHLPQIVVSQHDLVPTFLLSHSAILGHPAGTRLRISEVARREENRL